MSRHKVSADRSLELAIGAARLIGVVLLCFGSAVMMRGGYFNRYHLYRSFFLGLGLIVWVAPGALLLTCSFYLKHRRRFALRAAQVTTLSELFFATVFLAANFFLSPISPIPILLCILWLLCAIQLLRYLHDARFALLSRAELQRGFETISPQPVIPVQHTTDQTPRD